MSQDDLEQRSKAELIALVRAMRDQLAAAERGVDTGGGAHVGGDVEAEAFVGRDRISGFSGEEVNQILRTLLEFFPRDLLQPSRLGDTLSQFRQLYAQVLEWKELHDKLDGIIIAFDPYNSKVQHFVAKRDAPDLPSLRVEWIQVAQGVDGLVDWAREVRHIDRPYHVFPDGSKSGLKPAIELSDCSAKIADLLETQARPTWTQRRLFQQLGQEICEWAARFNSIVRQHMTLADKNLRDTAIRIYYLLESSLGGGMVHEAI